MNGILPRFTQNGFPLGLIMVTFLFYFILTLISVGVGFLIEKSSFGKRHRIWSDPIKKGQLRIESLAGIRYVLLAAVTTTYVLYAGHIRFQESSVILFLLTFGIFYFIFEVWHYLLHRIFHSKILFRFHRLHHLSSVTTPLSGVSFSFVEAMAWVTGYILFPALLSHLIPIDFHAWYFFIAFHWFMNIIGHINVEILPDAMNNNFFTLFSHPFTYHALHHCKGSIHFGLYTSFMDRLLKTEMPGWRKYQLKVNSGKPMSMGDLRNDISFENNPV
jgi:sterol desaturase/sphingolipid hydroxylase (fatty acid hydroxylase superfamily)